MIKEELKAIEILEKHKNLIMDNTMDVSYECITEAIKQLEDLQNRTFEDIAKDMIKYLNENHHPHTRIVTDSSTCEIVEGLKCFHTTEYIKD